MMISRAWIRRTLLTLTVAAVVYGILITWGYADYVGKGGAFDFAATLRDFNAGAPSLDPKRSGLYLRYHLLVADLLDHQGMTADELLSTGMPSAPIEAALAASGDLQK